MPGSFFCSSSSELFPSSSGQSLFGMDILPERLKKPGPGEKILFKMPSEDIFRQFGQKKFLPQEEQFHGRE